MQTQILVNNKSQEIAAFGLWLTGGFCFAVWRCQFVWEGMAIDLLGQGKPRSSSLTSNQILIYQVCSENIPIK